MFSSPSSLPPSFVPRRKEGEKDEEERGREGVAMRGEEVRVSPALLPPLPPSPPLPSPPPPPPKGLKNALL